MRVFKYELVGNEARVMMPEGARVLRVERQMVGQVISSYLWALVDPERKLEVRTFRTFSTGGEIPDGGDYIGTYEMGDHGWTIWHVFEYGKATDGAG